MGYDSLINHYQTHELQYAIRSFVVGFANAVQFEVFVSYLYGFMINNGQMKDYLQFMILLEGVAVCAGYFNAAFMLRIDIIWRYLLYTIVESLNWVTFISVYFFVSELSFFVQTNLVVSCCLVARISSAIGNCTNYGQLKSLP